MGSLQLELLVACGRTNRAIQISTRSMEKNHVTATFFALCLALLLATNIQGNPLPQNVDDYGEWDEETAARSGKQAESEESEDALGSIFGDILAGAGSLIDELGGIVHDVTSGDKNATDTIGDVVKVGTDAAHEVGRIGVEAVGQAPKILEAKVKFAQGLGQTLADTSGQFRQGLDDVSTQFKVASAFARTYSELALEHVGKFFGTFSKRLKCNTDCEQMESGAGQEQCKKENCIAIEVPKTPQEMEEEYDYSYGYEDDSAPDPK